MRLPNVQRVSRGRSDTAHQTAAVGFTRLLCGAFDEIYTVVKDGPRLLQSLEATPSDQVLVVPLDISRFSQPTPKFLGANLIDSSVSSLSGFETPFLFQSLLLKGLTTPEEQAYAILELAVPDNRVPIEEPDRMGVPYLVLPLR
jgi:hypothetical protein